MRNLRTYIIRIIIKIRRFPVNTMDHNMESPKDYQIMNAALMLLLTDIALMLFYYFRIAAFM